MNPAEVVIKQLGIRPLARKLDIEPSTIIHWRRTGRIPSKYHVQLIELSDGNIDPIDLIYGRDHEG